MFAGATNSFSGGYRNPFIVKLNNDGTQAWSKVLSPTNFSEAHTILESPTGTLLVSGRSSVGGPDNLFLCELTADGEVLAFHSYSGSGGTYQMEGGRMERTSDGGYLLGGDIRSTQTNNIDAFAVRTSSDGAMEWARAFGTPTTPDHGIAVGECGDGGFLITGTTVGLIGPGEGSSYIIKTDEFGMSGCDQSNPSIFHNLRSTYTADVQVTWGAPEFLAGTLTLPALSRWGYDVLCSGNSTTGLPVDVVSDEHLLAYITNGGLIVELPIAVHNNPIHIRDLQGKIVRSLNSNGDGRIYCELSGWATGVYIVELSHHGKKLFRVFHID